MTPPKPRPTFITLEGFMDTYDRNVYSEAYKEPMMVSVSVGPIGSTYKKPEVLVKAGGLFLAQNFVDCEGAWGGKLYRALADLNLTDLEAEYRLMRKRTKREIHDMYVEHWMSWVVGQGLAEEVEMVTYDWEA